MNGAAEDVVTPQSPRHLLGLFEQAGSQYFGVRDVDGECCFV